MVINDGYAEQTRRLLAEAQSELKAEEGEMDILRDRIATLMKEVQAYETALQGYLRRKGKDVTTEPDWNEILKDSGSHKKRIKAIAEHKGGKIKVSEVTDILYTKGFIHAQKRSTAYAMVQSYLADMAEAGELQKVAPGEYELIGAQRSLLRVNQ
jgi:hypothetical protein